MDSLPIHKHNAPPMAIATNAKIKQARPWFLGLRVRILFINKLIYRIIRKFSWHKRIVRINRIVQRQAPLSERFSVHSR